MASVSVAIINLATGVVLNTVVVDLAKDPAPKDSSFGYVVLSQPADQSYVFVNSYGFLSPGVQRLFNLTGGTKSPKTLVQIKGILTADVGQTRADLLALYSPQLTGPQLSAYTTALNTQRDILIAEVNAMGSVDEAMAFQQHGWPRPSGF